ncbi:MAG: sensor histidine kinase, partial [Bacteroidota bacterium]
MKGSLIKWLIVLGSVAILGILSIQTYWLYRTWSLREAEFDQKVRASLFKVANNLAGLANIPLPTRQNLVQQISTDYYLVNIDHAFDASDLEVALRYHLESALL